MYGLDSTDDTANSTPSSAAARTEAAASSSTSRADFLVLAVPSSAKSLPVATRSPATVTSSASNRVGSSATANVPVRSQ